MKKQIKLEDLERNDIFTAPEGYFDKLPNRIHARLELAGQEDEPKVHQLTPKSLYYIAASVAVFLIATILIIRVPEEDDSPQNILAEVTTDAMIEYLEMSDVNVTDISLPEEEQQQLLDNQWQDWSIPDDYANQFTPEELELEVY